MQAQKEKGPAARFFPSLPLQPPKIKPFCSLGWAGSYEKEAAVKWSGGGRAGHQWDEIRPVVEGLQPDWTRPVLHL